MFPKGRNMHFGRSWCVEGLKIRRFFESLFLGVRVERFNPPFPIACTVALAFPFDVRRDTSGTGFAYAFQALDNGALFRPFLDATPLVSVSRCRFAAMMKKGGDEEKAQASRRRPEKNADGK